MEMRQALAWHRLEIAYRTPPVAVSPKHVFRPEHRISTNELTPVRPPLVFVASLIKLYVVPLPSDRIAQHVFPSIHRVNSSGDKRTSYNSFLQLLLT
jgi:hypothetical protein